MKFLNFLMCVLGAVGFCFIFAAAIAGSIPGKNIHIDNAAIFGAILLFLSALLMLIKWYRQMHPPSKLSNTVFPDS